MKTKIQKKAELEKGKKLAEKSQALIFADFSSIKAEDLRKLRQELGKVNASFLVIKKRLLNLILKEKGIDFNGSKFKFSIGTVFSESDLENSCNSIVKFFSELEGAGAKKVLGGYDFKNKAFMEAERVIFIGKLPAREILLGQLLGILQSPISSLIYLMKEKSRKVELSAS